jgi:hypothetical protein
MGLSDPIGVGLPTVEVELEGGGRLVVRFGWEVVRGRLEATGMEVESSRPLAAEVVRSVRWASVVEDARRRYLALAQTAAAGRLEEIFGSLYTDARQDTREEVAERVTGRAQETLSALEERPGRPGRPRQYGREHFEEVARIYSEAYAKGEPPTRTVAERFQVSRSAAAKWVARARDAGLLPEAEGTRPRGRTAEAQGEEEGS